jgi:hypothetical protein
MSRFVHPLLSSVLTLTRLLSIMSSIPATFSWSDVHADNSTPSIASSSWLASTAFAPDIHQIVITSPSGLVVGKYKSIEGVDEHFMSVERLLDLRLLSPGAHRPSWDAEVEETRGLFLKNVAMFAEAAKRFEDAEKKFEDAQKKLALTSRPQQNTSLYRPGLATVAEADENEEIQEEVDAPEPHMSTFVLFSSTFDFG